MTYWASVPFQVCQCLIQNKRIQSEYELVIQIQVLAAFALCNMHEVSVSVDFVNFYEY